MANRYWVGGTGTWTSTTTNWSATDGGAGGASVPTSADSVFFTINSNVGTGAFTVTVTSGTCLNLSIASDLDGVMTLTGSGSIDIYGNLSILAPTSNFISSGYTGTLTFRAASSSKTIQTSGNILSCALTFNGSSATWTLQDALNTSAATVLTAGTLALSSYTLTTSSFNSNGGGFNLTRAIAFGTTGGQISISGNSGVVLDVSVVTGFSYTGTSKFNFTYSGSTGTREVYVAPLAETTSFNLNISAGSDIFYFNTPGTNVCTYKTLNFSGFSGTIALTTNAVTLYGDLTIPATATTSGTTYVLTFGATSGTQLASTNGVDISWPVTISGGSTVQLGGAFTKSVGAFLFTKGVFDTQSYNLTLNTFSSTGSLVRTLTLGSSYVTITGSGSSAWNTTSSLTVTASTATISMTSASAKTFVGSGLTWPTLNQGGTGALTITGANTFDTISNTTQPASVLFTAATTTTLSNLNLNGTAGNLITIGSATTSNHTLSKSSGTVTVSYCTISRSTATGGATWRAPTNLGNVNGSNNTGWSFATIVLTVAAGVRNFFAFF